jgi:type II secretory pathway pseudopilin PulG
MKSLPHPSLRLALGALLVLAMGIGLSEHARLPALPENLQAGVVVLVMLAVLFASLFRRLRSEDRIARLEAALCREQKARSQADQALAESDMLLGRLTAAAATSIRSPTWWRSSPSCCRSGASTRWKIRCWRRASICCVPASIASPRRSSRPTPPRRAERPPSSLVEDQGGAIVRDAQSVLVSKKLLNRDPKDAT